MKKKIIKKPVINIEYASVAWTIEDIKEKRPKWSKKKCNEFLMDNEKYISEGMIERGDAIIEDLLD